MRGKRFASTISSGAENPPTPLLGKGDSLAALQVLPQQVDGGLGGAPFGGVAVAG